LRDSQIIAGTWRKQVLELVDEGLLVDNVQILQLEHQQRVLVRHHGAINGEFFE
jgi:hypothetical protein